MTDKSRLSVSVDSDLVAAGRTTVQQGEARTLSAWVNDALRRQVAHQVRLRALQEFVTAYEAEQGVITDEEMTAAVRRARSSAVVVRGGEPTGRQSRRRA